MSTRWYPLYQRGNPQLRVFLSNFWLKLVPPEKKQPKNIVKFHCSMEMTRMDVKNYLEKIYNVKSIHVRTRIQLGKFDNKNTGYVVKDDDIKLAYVVLPRDQSFVFPDVFVTEDTTKEKEDENEHLEQLRKGYQDYLTFNKQSERFQLPGWYSI
ncbi:probable 39S ribosomal protein L23, mitochondrial [Leptopilina heterotoma]|uniref:probable 39S ribosomal protein L23, mitochondrial n=1 Tax=Leptopilina heterotoma TaxID=63436 RepID=UPI001CAA090B|nr:probable 39S ribosomal protein L23, mitochondrial [Leptopilina heterotoma]